MTNEIKRNLKNWLKSFVSAEEHRVVRDLTVEEERARYSLKNKPSSSNGEELYKHYFDTDRKVNIELITKFITWFNESHGLRPALSFDLPYHLYNQSYRLLEDAEEAKASRDLVYRYIYEQLRVMTNILSIFDPKFKLDTLLEMIDLPTVNLDLAIKRYDDYMLPRIFTVAENIRTHERFKQKLTEARETHVTQRLQEYRAGLVLNAFATMYERQDMEDFNALRGIIFHACIHYGLEFELVMVNKKIGKLLPYLRDLTKI